MLSLFCYSNTTIHAVLSSVLLFVDINEVNSRFRFKEEDQEQITQSLFLFFFFLDTNEA